MWETHSIVRTDVFSYTAFGVPWVNHEWFTQLILFGIYRFGGFVAIGITTALLGAVTFVFMVQRTLWKASSLAVLLVVAYALREFFVPRPQVFAYICLAALCFGLERFMRSRNRSWGVFMVAMFFIWGNIHASVVVGVGLLVFILIGIMVHRWYVTRSIAEAWQAARPLCIITVLGVVASLINPFGYTIYTYAFQPFRHVVAYHMLIETRPLLASLNKNGMVLVICMHGALALTMLWRRKVLAVYEIPAIAVFWIAPFVSVKYLPFSWVFIIPLAVNLLPSMRGVAVIISRGAAVGLAVVAVALGAVSGRAWEDPHSKWPRELVAFIQNSQLVGNMYNPYSWGGYLMWQVPERKVFIDGRFEMFANRNFFDALNFTDGKNVDALIEKYNFAYALVRPWESLAFHLSVRPDWSLVYWDNFGMVYVRRGTGNDATIKQYGMNIPYMNDTIEATVRKVGAQNLPALVGQYQEAVRRQSNLLLGRLTLGFLEQATNDCPDAVTQWQAIVAYDTTLGAAHTGLAQCYIVMGQRALAVREYDLAKKYQKNQRWWLGRE
jgi:hypothetical protein